MHVLQDNSAHDPLIFRVISQFSLQLNFQATILQTRQSGNQHVHVSTKQTDSTFIPFPLFSSTGQQVTFLILVWASATNRQARLVCIYVQDICVKHVPLDIGRQ